MEATERLIRTWMASGRDQEIEETASEISSGTTTLLNVVKGLGEYLTAEEDALRTKGVEFLSAVIERVPDAKVSRQSARVLIAFYCGKLDDTETVVPALKGLVSLSALPNCASTDAEDVIQALFKHVQMKALTQNVRFLVFSIIDALMARHRGALKGMGSSFITSYATLAEGEKDPRNLLLAFAIARVILIEFDTTNHIETMFNITFCYFPITFRPPPNDPYGITTEDLRTALRICLNSNPAFGPMAIPVFLEKLTAGSPATKRDTLQTLSACLPVYGAALARSFARKLWSSLKLEIFQPTDPQTEEEALKTVQDLVKTIYSDNTEDVDGLAKDACEECIGILREPEKSQAKPAIKVICAFMSTTPTVSKYTISKAVPHLVRLFLDPDEVGNRAPIVLLLAELISAARLSMTKFQEGEEGSIPLLPFKDEVLGVMTVGLKSLASCPPALEGLRGMVTTPGLLSDEELGFVVLNVNDTLQVDPEEGVDASDAALDLLSTISENTPRHVEEQTLPLLFSSLPDQAPSQTAHTERAKYWRVLSALSRLCIQPALFETLVVRLTTKLDLICVPSTPLEDVEAAAAYAHSVLTTLANTLSKKVDAGHADVAKYVDRIVPRLYNLFIHTALVEGGEGMVAAYSRLVTAAGQIITLVVQTLPVQRQETFVAALFPAFLEGKVGGIAEGHQKIPSEPAFMPFAIGAPTLQRNLAVLFAAPVIALRKEVAIPVADLNPFLTSLMSWTLDSAGSDLQRDAALSVVASLVNKRTDDVTPFLTSSLDEYWPREIADPAVDVGRRRAAIKSWAQISKALLVRNHPLLTKFTDRLFEIFDDEDINWDAARAIGQIGGGDSVLSKKNFAILRILHAQKFLNSVLPRIVEGAKSAEKPREQTANLVALTALIKSIPKTTYAHEMPSLIPLLLRGLELPDTDIRANVIDTFLAAADGDSSIISEHASKLVTIMLKNSVVDEMPSIKVRTAALKYLGALPSIVRYDVLHPYKATVLRELGKVLDDPKRSVRKEAVDARTNWFKYSG